MESMNSSNPYKLAWQRIRRAPYQALAAISVMTVTLFLGCMFAILISGSYVVLKHFESQPQINAFFKADIVPTQPQIEKIKDVLQQTGLVSQFKYVSKEDALKIYKDLNKNDPLLLEAVTTSMLPASIEVSAINVSDLKQISEILKKQDGIDDVRFAEDVVNQLKTWTDSIRIIGIVLVGILVFISLVVILLVIGVKVAHRRDDIHTYRLVGATKGYIAMPFIYEGMIYGVLGGFIAWGITYLILLYSMGFLVSFLAGIPLLPPPLWFMFTLLAGVLTLGGMLGGIGGWITVNRFIKE